jgi:glyoxylase-like metal-dependent hydrolase (beta-lactamase superfamily II)
MTDATPEPPNPSGTDRLYFRQLLAGRDFAVDDQIAQQMVNFVYLVGDKETGEAVIVDPAYGVDDLLGMLAADGMECVGALVTHFHADHVGGDLMGWSIEGIARLLEVAQVPVHVQADEAPWVVRSTGVGAGELAAHGSGDVIQVGEVPITLVHTPGHTPGSQCFLVDGRLIAGDTLFLDGCGRTDLPGGDPEAMYESLTTRLAKVPDETVLYPGHLYSPDPSATMGHTRSNNYVFRLRTPEQWMTMFGR